MRWQALTRQAPSNGSMDRLVDWLLMPKIGNNWWYNTIYRAVIQSTARRSAGRVGSKISRGTEKVRTGLGCEDRGWSAFR